MLRVREHSANSVGYARFEREFDKFLACGLLERGFVRVRCGDCATERLVAFSCKTRGFCPSCTSRRMADTAAHLVDRVLPHVPYRQWVLSLPCRVRFLLARDSELLGWVVTRFLAKIFAWQRRRARRLGLIDPRRKIEVDDRDALERLCRYGARSPIANSRLSLDGRGRVVIALKRPPYATVAASSSSKISRNLSLRSRMRCALDALSLRTLA